MLKIRAMFSSILIGYITFAVFLLSGPASVGAATYTVINLNDNGPGSLRQAINDANGTLGTSTVNFSVTGTITLTTGELYIISSVRINGPGSGSLTVSGNSASRVFNVNANHVIISGITIRGGVTGLGGGGINNTGSLIVRDCTIDGNSANASFGGGINNGGTLDIYNTTITNNFGGMAGGAINNYGTLTIMGSTIYGNTSPSYGAGINSGGILNIVSSSIFSNTGTSSCRGGGLLNSGGSATISGSTISSNTSGSGGGGGIVNDGVTMTITDSTISNNSAPGSFGGGIRNGASLTVISSSLTNNSAGAGFGGGIQNDAAGTVVLTNSTLSSNSSGYASGGIGNSGSMTVSGSTVFLNTSSYGGGIYSDGSLAMTNSTITTNSAGSAGGGLYHGGGTVSLLNCTVGGNMAVSGSGGIVGDTSAGAVFSLRNTIVSNNGQNCSGIFTSQGHNLSDDNSCTYFTATGDLNNLDPYLGLLAFNGGWTMTHALAPISSAIDLGDPNTFPATDQRGWPRPAGVRADIGAVEIMSSRLLTVTKTGTGLGRVRSNPGGIDCSAGCTTDSSEFPLNGSVSMSAIPLSGPYIFAGWSGAGCAESISMNADRACSVQFTQCGGNPVQDPLSNLYAYISDAYDVIASGNLKITASNRMENLRLDRAVSIGLLGGYACDFLSSTGVTYITGTVTISAGTVVMDKIAIL
ncbi:MAG: hypothetical protein M0024_00440 [Nitrospiraceae bacterium]|nr:hypothetical protein [Nitrospiraceae bacterium]